MERRDILPVTYKEALLSNNPQIPADKRVCEDQHDGDKQTVDTLSLIHISRRG